MLPALPLSDLVLCVLPSRLAVARLPPSAEAPWARQGALISITRTARELSVICDERLVPEGVPVEAGYRAIEVQGPLDFSITGLMYRLLAPFDAHRISILAMSTYDTDYVMVAEARLEEAVAALKADGARFIEKP